MIATVDKWTAREIIRHAMVYVDKRYPDLKLRHLATHDENWGVSTTESSFWTAFYDDIVKHLPYVEGTQHKFDNHKTEFDVRPQP